jgi:hypothetical protein
VERLESLGRIGGRVPLLKRIERGRRGTRLGRRKLGAGRVRRMGDGKVGWRRRWSGRGRIRCCKLRHVGSVFFGLLISRMGRAVGLFFERGFEIGARGRNSEDDCWSRVMRVEVEERIGLVTEEIVGRGGATAGNTDGLREGEKVLQKRNSKLNVSLAASMGNASREKMRIRKAREKSVP